MNKVTLINTMYNKLDNESQRGVQININTIMELLQNPLERKKE